MHSYVVYCKDLNVAEFYLQVTPAAAAECFIRARIYYNKEGSTLSEKVFSNLKVGVLDIETGEVTKLFIRAECIFYTQEYSEGPPTSNQEEIDFYFGIKNGTNLPND